MTKVAPVMLVESTRHEDSRGYFSEIFKRELFVAAGLTADFIQENESLSVEAGTVRGVHFQSGSSAQTKLVSVAVGAVFDVAVDLRRSSETFGQHVTMELSGKNGRQLYVPRGFGHAFCTLEPGTIVRYKIDRHYDPSAERTVRWDDPELGIEWPAGAGTVVSPKDASAPLLRHATELFE